MRRPGVRIPSRPPSFKTTSSVPNSSYRGTLGLSSLPDSFRYLVIHPERHCLSAAASVNTSRLPGTYPHDAQLDYFRIARRFGQNHKGSRNSMSPKRANAVIPDCAGVLTRMEVHLRSKLSQNNYLAFHSP